jgi:hypothetical protein
LETIIFGLQLKAGDEIVATKQDYPNMVNAYKQRERRDGIKMVWVNLELPSEDENYLVSPVCECVYGKNKSGTYYTYYKLEWANHTREKDRSRSS